MWWFALVHFLSRNFPHRLSLLLMVLWVLEAHTENVNRAPCSPQSGQFTYVQSHRTY